MMSSIFSCACCLFVYLLWRTRWYFSPIKLADVIFKIFVWCNVIEAILMENAKCWLKKSYFCLKMGLFIAQFWSRHEDNRYSIPKWVVWYTVLSGSVMPDSLWPHGLCPPGSSVHVDSPGKNTAVDCHVLFQVWHSTIKKFRNTYLRSSKECEVKWALESITTNKASGGDGIPVELFQILKDDAVKVLTQYASKFGKLSSGHRTGKGQFSFQSQRKAMPKNAQTTTQLHSSHTLVK